MALKRFSAYRGVGQTGLYLAKNAVHDPVDTGGRDAVGSAVSCSLKMLYDLLDEGELDMLGIGNRDFMTAFAGLENNGTVGEDGKAYPAFFAYQLNLVGLGTLVTYKAPAAAAWKAALEGECCRYCIFGLVKSAKVGTETIDVNNGAKKLLEQVQLMRCQIVEITASGNVALHSPREIGAVVVEIARGYGETNLNVDNLAYGVCIEQFTNLVEIRQTSAVICHKAWDTSLCTNAHDSLAVHIGGCQRLFDIHGLAGLHGHNGVCGMGRGWGGNVYCIDLRVVDE